MLPEEICYICFEKQSEENTFVDPNPCNCKGTIKIHSTCFDILISRNDICKICGKKFIQNGYKKYYYLDGGPLKEEGLLVNGLHTGTWKAWHKNGQLWVQLNYIDGKKNGLYQSWYNDGRLEYKINYVDGEKNGLYQSWNKNGRLIEEVNFVDGERTAI